jgi:hypothetical protein
MPDIEDPELLPRTRQNALWFSKDLCHYRADAAQRRRSAAMSGLPVEQAYRLADRAEEQRWLVTELWSEQAVGIVGGEPECAPSHGGAQRVRELATAHGQGRRCQLQPTCAPPPANRHRYHVTASQAGIGGKNRAPLW